MSELTESGLNLYAEFRGHERAEHMRNAIESEDFGATMTTLAMDFVFGSVWTRGGLDRKSRSLVTIGILIALRQSEELKNHIRIGITNGGKSTRDRQDALLSRSAPASLQWLAQRQALWPPEYCRARWIDVREMA